MNLVTEVTFTPTTNAEGTGILPAVQARPERAVRVGTAVAPVRDRRKKHEDGIYLISFDLWCHHPT